MKSPRKSSLWRLTLSYYNVAKTYSLEEFDNHFIDFKNKCSVAAVFLEHDIDFEKWRRAHFLGNRYDVMTTNITESLNVMLIDKREYLVASKFNSIAKSLENFLGRGMHVSLNIRVIKRCRLRRKSQEKK